MFKRKTIFDIIREAEDDQQQSDTAQSQTDQTEDQAPSAEESDAQGADDASAAEDDDYGSDDDFNIDTSLDDEPDTTGGDNDTEIGTDDGGSDNSGDSSLESEDEPVEANTDIFSSLTPEEQQIKIKELKRLFAQMYSSTDDLLDKINTIESNEDNIEIMSRISMVMYSLKQYISDYMVNSFANKSYIENDIAFNRFLSILNSVSSVIEDLVKIKELNKV